MNATELVLDEYQKYKDLTQSKLTKHSYHKENLYKEEELERILKEIVTIKHDHLLWIEKNIQFFLNQSFFTDNKKGDSENIKKALYSIIRSQHKKRTDHINRSTVMRTMLAIVDLFNFEPTILNKMLGVSYDNRARGNKIETIFYGRGTPGFDNYLSSNFAELGNPQRIEDAGKNYVRSFEGMLGSMKGVGDIIKSFADLSRSLIDNRRDIDMRLREEERNFMCEICLMNIDKDTIRINIEYLAFIRDYIATLEQLTDESVIDKINDLRKKYYEVVDDIRHKYGQIARVIVYLTGLEKDSKVDFTSELKNINIRHTDIKVDKDTVSFILDCLSNLELNRGFYDKVQEKLARYDQYNSIVSEERNKMLLDIGGTFLNIVACKIGLGLYRPNVIIPNEAQPANIDLQPKRGRRVQLGCNVSINPLQIITIGIASTIRYMKYRSDLSERKHVYNENSISLITDLLRFYKAHLAVYNAYQGIITTINRLEERRKSELKTGLLSQKDYESKISELYESMRHFNERVKKNHVRTYFRLQKALHTSNHNIRKSRSGRSIERDDEE